VSPGRTIIDTGAHCAVSRRDPAPRMPLPQEPSPAVGAALRESNLCREPLEDDRTGDGIVERNECGR
jgi:hypothetical protein